MSNVSSLCRCDNCKMLDGCASSEMEKLKTELTQARAERDEYRRTLAKANGDRDKAEDERDQLREELIRLQSGTQNPVSSNRTTDACIQYVGDLREENTKLKEELNAARKNAEYWREEQQKYVAQADAMHKQWCLERDLRFFVESDNQGFIKERDAALARVRVCEEALKEIRLRPCNMKVGCPCCVATQALQGGR